MDADDVITRLRLEPVPGEGGWFRRHWTASASGPGGRPAATAILYLLSDGPSGRSRFHRLDADELWHYHGGDAAELVELRPDGGSAHVRLGSDLAAEEAVVHAVPAGTWMGARTLGSWTLVGTTVVPGFSEAGFELADRPTLLARWPAERAAIDALTS